jgi:hypothetical protein
MKHPPKFLLCALLAILPAFVFADPAMIDECRYPDDATARSTWSPMGSTAVAAAAKVAGRDAVRLPCNRLQKCLPMCVYQCYLSRRICPRITGIEERKRDD